MDRALPNGDPRPDSERCEARLMSRADEGAKGSVPGRRPDHQAVIAAREALNKAASEPTHLNAYGTRPDWYDEGHAALDSLAAALGSLVQQLQDTEADALQLLDQHISDEVRIETQRRIIERAASSAGRETERTHGETEDLAEDEPVPRCRHGYPITVDEHARACYYMTPPEPSA